MKQLSFIEHQFISTSIIYFRTKQLKSMFLQNNRNKLFKENNIK